MSNLKAISKVRQILMMMSESADVSTSFLDEKTQFVSINQMAEEIRKEYGELASNVFSKFAVNKQLSEAEITQFKNILAQFFKNRIELARNEGVDDFTSRTCLRKIEELK